MGPAQTETPTKERLMDAAQQLMLSKGFSATTVDEICETAKLTKGSFFHYFKSKDELGKELLTRYCADNRRCMTEWVGADPDPLQRVYAYIDSVIKAGTESPRTEGCLLGMFAQELCDLNPEIQATCKQEFAGWAKAFGGELAKAKAKYAPKKAFDPQELAEHLIATMEGSMILAKAQQDARVLKNNLQHYKAYVKSLFET